MVDTIVRRSSRTQGTPACRAAMPTASPIGPAPMTRRSVDSMSPLDLDDLIPPRPHAHVPGGHARERLEPIEVGPGLGGQVGEAPGAAGGATPPRQHLVPGPHLAQELDLGRHLLAPILAEVVGGADRDFVEGVEYVELG